MSVESDIADLNSRANQIIDHTLPYRYADALAVGYFADDLETVSTTDGDVDAAGMIAVVYQNKLYNLSISDAYLSVPPDELSAIINGVMINAFSAYQEVHDALVQQAREVLDAEGHSGQDRIQQAIDNDEPMVG